MEPEALEEDSGLPALSRALLAHLAGQPELALAILENRRRVGPETDLRLMLMAATGRWGTLLELLGKVAEAGGDSSACQLPAMFAAYLHFHPFFDRLECRPAPSWDPGTRAVVSAFLASSAGPHGAGPSRAPVEPGDGALAASLAGLQQKGGRDASKVRFLEKAASLNPSQAVHRLNAGVALLVAGDIPRAIYHLKAAAAGAPGGLVPQLYLYLAHLLREDWDRALETVEGMGGRLPAIWVDWLAGLMPPGFELPSPTGRKFPSGRDEVGGVPDGG